MHPERHPLPGDRRRHHKSDADGAKSVSISTDIHEVVLTLEETVDISKVNIREVSFNDEAVAASDPIVGTKDLSKPLTVTLSAYENERSWAIKAEQPIERYFSLSGGSVAR